MAMQIVSRNPAGRRSKTRSTIALVAIAAAGYIAGALVQETLAPRNDSAAIAQPARTAEINDALPEAGTFPFVSGIDEPHRFDAEWSQTPRECDLARGIETACIFMD